MWLKVCSACMNVSKGGRRCCGQLGTPPSTIPPALHVLHKAFRDLEHLLCRTMFSRPLGPESTGRPRAPEASALTRVHHNRHCKKDQVSPSCRSLCSSEQRISCGRSRPASARGRVEELCKREQKTRRSRSNTFAGDSWVGRANPTAQNISHKFTGGQWPHHSSDCDFALRVCAKEDMLFSQPITYNDVRLPNLPRTDC